MAGNWLNRLDILMQAGGSTMEHLQDRYGPKAEKLGRAQSTVLHWAGVGGKPYGFYIPYPKAAELPSADETDTIEWLRDRMDAEQATYRTHLDVVDEHLEGLNAAVSDDDRDAPSFEQEGFSGLDAASAYAFVRHFGPRNIVEVGPGASTRFLARAVRDAGLKTIFSSIGPQPEVSVDHLCDLMLRTGVERVPLREFDRLDEGDVLFFNGSHVAMPGTDTDYMLTRVLPTLRKGVLVYIHGIQLPHGYPAAWAEGSYNEQLVVAGMLSGGDRYRILLPCAYCARHMAEDVKELDLPLHGAARQSGLWLQVTR